jgi:hypothetical protein
MPQSEQGPSFTGDSAPVPERPKDGSYDSNRSAVVIAATELFEELRSGFSALCGRISALVKARRKALPSFSSGGSLAQRRSRRFPALLIAVLSVILIVMVGAAGAIIWALQGLPLQYRPSDSVSTPLLLEASNGQPLGRIGPVPGERAKRGDLPDQLVAAVVSTEDRRFFSHWGVDLRGMARALYVDLVAGDVVEGGSTITQQLAKMQLVGNERTFTRKLREVFAAIWLELQLSKDEILTRYLNNVYLGAGAHGVSTAARVYFDKPLSELTLAESAMLAGLIKAPSEFNPLQNLAAAQQRASVVLDGMVDAGAITAEQAEQAKAQPATTKSQVRTARAHTWFADWIAKYEFPRAIGQSTQSMRVRTTLRPDLQQIAEQAVAQVLDSAGVRRDVHQVALIAMRPNGAVLAMVGGRDYDKNQFNRAVDAKRQPGSAFSFLCILQLCARAIHQPAKSMPVRSRSGNGSRRTTAGGSMERSRLQKHSPTRSIQLPCASRLRWACPMSLKLRAISGSTLLCRRCPALPSVRAKSACSNSRGHLHRFAKAACEYNHGGSPRSVPRTALFARSPSPFPWESRSGFSSN